MSFTTYMFYKDSPKLKKLRNYNYLPISHKIYNLGAINYICSLLLAFMFRFKFMYVDNTLYYLHMAKQVWYIVLRRMYKQI